MINLEKLVVKNHPPLFKNIEWRLNKAPISVIYGINHDSKQGSRNGVGKSMLPGILANLILAIPPYATKKGSAKELVTGEARDDLHFTVGGKKKTIYQYAKGKSVRYGVTENGKDKAIKDIAEARAKIESLIPLKSEHFYGQVYLSSYRPSILLSGTSSQRSDYFESIFDLAIYDAMAKELNKRKYKLDLSERQFTALKSKSSELKSNSDNASLVDIEVAFKETKAKSRDLMLKLKGYNKELNLLSSYVAIAEQITTSLSPTALARKLDTQRLLYKELNEQYDDYQKQLGAYESNKASAAKRKILIEKYKKLPSYDKNEIFKEQKDLSIRLKKLQAKVDLREEYSDEIDKYLQMDKKLIKPVDAFGKLDEKIKDLENTINGLKYAVQAMSELKGKATCPSCGQSVSSKYKHSREHDLQKALDTNTKSLREYKATRWYNKLIKIIPLDLINDTGIFDRLKQTANDLELVEQKIETLQIKSELRQQIKDIPKPITIKLDKNSDLAKKRSEVAESINTLKSDLKLHENLAKTGEAITNFDSAKLRQKALIQTVESIEPRLHKLNDRLVDLSSKLSMETAIKQQLQALHNEMLQLQEELEDKDLYLALAQAYSPKGIRIQQIKSLANSYVSIMNTNHSTLYTKSFLFSEDVDNNKFDIMATRNDSTSDIRSLSGSESRKFLALSAYAQTKLTPDSMRLNIMILDEIEAGLSTIDRQLFCNEFIPLLQQLVPNIHIITPLDPSQMYINNADRILLACKNNVTTLHYSA